METVRQGKIDGAIVPTEGDRRFGTIPSKWCEALPLASSQNHCRGLSESAGQALYSHGLTLHSPTMRPAEREIGF